jgi:galactose mutarotase-like enzyme
MTDEGERFTIVVLRDRPNSLEASFVPALGMLCCSLRHRGEELLAQRAGLDAYARRGKTMGIPLLYPWANRLAGFDYTVAGREVAVPNDPQRVALDGNGLPIHGVVGGRIEWELARATREEGRLRARLSWDEAKAGLFEVFPFRHNVEYEARLADRRLEIVTTLHACGEDAVPVAFGFHPYLTMPGVAREDWRVDLPAMRPLALDDRQIPIGAAGPKLAAHSLRLAAATFDDGFDELAMPARFAVSAGSHRTADGAHRVGEGAGGEAEGICRITLQVIEGFPCAQLYAPPDSEVICFEPMTAPANALCSGNGLRMLAPGERYRASFAVSVEELAQSK